MAVYTRNNIVTNGLVIALDAANPMSYTSGSTIWRDISGNNVSGSLVNGSVFTPQDGGAVTLDGINDYINIPYSGSTSGSFTFNIIMKCNTMTTSSLNRQTLFGLSQNFNPAFRQFDIEVWGSGGVGFRGNGGSAEGSDFSAYGWTPGVDANTANIYTVTLNSAGHSVYVNGMFRNNIIQPYTSSFNSITLGVRGGGGSFWNGSCYYFSMYNRMLTQAEITQNYNALKTRFGLT